MKTGGALSCDCVGGCWGRPLSGDVPRGMLSWVGRYGCLVGWEPLVCHQNMVAISPGNPQGVSGRLLPVGSSPPEVLARGWGSRGGQHLGLLTILLRWQPGLEWVPELDVAVPAQAGTLSLPPRQANCLRPEERR